MMWEAGSFVEVGRHLGVGMRKWQTHGKICLMLWPEAGANGSRVAILVVFLSVSF